jgi:hypothetical protein
MDYFPQTGCGPNLVELEVVKRNQDSDKERKRWALGDVITFDCQGRRTHCSM